MQGGTYGWKVEKMTTEKYGEEEILMLLKEADFKKK